MGNQQEQAQGNQDIITKKHHNYEVHIFSTNVFNISELSRRQVYDIHFVNSDEDIVISFSKKLISDTKKCFKLTNEEQEKVKKFNLNQGAIKVMLNKIEVAKYSIIDISTSKTYKGKIYLCTVDGSVKFDENIFV